MMNDKKKIFIEKIGVRVEKMGYSPVAGRIFGTLLLAEPPHMTFDELCEALSASKSSISTNLNFLMKDSDSIVEYFTLPGDRKRYFKISTTNWKSHLNMIPEEFKNSNQLLQEILSYRTEYKLEESFTKDLQEILSFYQFMESHLPKLYAEWEAQNQK